MMNLETYDPRNPYFIFQKDKICAICLRKPHQSRRFPLDTILRDKLDDNTPIKVYEILECVSKFKYCSTGPQMICENCFKNTTSAYKFYLICNKAQTYYENFTKHQEIIMQKKLKESKPQVICVEDVEDVANVDDTVKILVKHQNTGKRGRDILLPSRKVQCNVCNAFCRADHLKIHMRRHTGERPFKCKICNYTAAQWSSLKAHVAAHENKRSNICSYCGKAFNFASGLRTHEKTHTNDKQYKCSICGMAFITRQCLKRHTITHTNEKPYSCEYCGKCYNRRNTLRVHLKIHTGEKPHVCDICGKAFIQNQSLKCHYRRHLKNGEIGEAGGSLKIVRQESDEVEEVYLQTEEVVCESDIQTFYENSKDDLQMLD